MNTPNYPAQIVNALQAQKLPPWQIIGYLQAILTAIQREAEYNDLSPQMVVQMIKDSMPR